MLKVLSQLHWRLHWILSLVVLEKLRGIFITEMIEYNANEEQQHHCEFNNATSQAPLILWKTHLFHSAGPQYQFHAYCLRFKVTLQLYFLKTFSILYGNVAQSTGHGIQAPCPCRSVSVPFLPLCVDNHAAYVLGH